MRCSRGTLLRGLACCLPSLLPRHAAIAWCGEPFPPYAYSLPWFEFDAGTSKLPLRVVGDRKAEVDRRMRPLLVLPSPGLDYEYLENLEALTISERRVAFADLTSGGTGGPDALTARVVDALSSLEAPNGVHLLGHGYGAALALRVASASGAGQVASLILASPLGSLEDAEAASRDELAKGPAPLLRSAATSGRACLDAELGKLRARPSSAATPPPPAGGELQMGALVAAARPTVPVLLTRGSGGDVSSEAAAAAVAGAVPGAARREFRGSFPPVDDRSSFAEELLSFMDSVDGTVSRRAVMASGSMMPAGRL